jgi:hypothetical protein
VPNSGGSHVYNYRGNADMISVGLDIYLDQLHDSFHCTGVHVMNTNTASVFGTLYIYI